MANNEEAKVAIITGGGMGGGIGYGLSTAFAKAGYNLVITGRNEKKLTDAKEELERLYGIQALTCQADGGVEEQVAGVIAKAAETFGRIDVLINNAQASKSGVLLVDHSKEDFDLAINSGLYAAFFYMKHAYPYLKATQGSVINFASGRRYFRTAGPELLCSSQGGHPRHDPCGRQRMGPRQHQLQRGLPAGDDRSAQGMAGAVSRSL